MEFADIIKQKREELGLNLRDFAEKLNTDHSTISRWERGESEPHGHSKERILKDVKEL